MKRTVISAICIMLMLCTLGCAGDNAKIKKGLGNGWEPVESMTPTYATQFAVDYYQDGYRLIMISDGSRFLVVPEGKQAPEGIDKSIILLYAPVENIYIAATSAMCLFDELDSLDSIGLSGTKSDGWYNENARFAMEQGKIQYAGKYSEPDYELILSEGCELSIQSMMIGHAPEVKEKLKELGIPVLVDRSSLEAHPLGRTEWIKFYGALLYEDERANELFDRQAAYLESLEDSEPTGKTVAFFHISTSGYAVARKSGDYVSKMIELAGGEYIFKDLGDPDTATSTVTLEMEKFYETAREADCIIYNSTIGGEIYTMGELLEKSELLADFKAVRNGNVWCTRKNLFQETTQLGVMIRDIHEILISTQPDTAELEFLYKLSR